MNQQGAKAVSDTDDELVSDYLRRLETVAVELPADRRRELIDEIAAHIAEARAALPADPGGIRAVLDQLGSPEDIVRAASATPAFADTEDQPLAASPGAGSRPGSADRTAPPGVLEIVAVIALLIGGLIVPVIGWVIGLVLLWVSNSWSLRDKLLGTLIWPGGLLAPVIVFAGIGAAAVVPVSSACTSGVAVATRAGSPVQVHPPTCTGSVIPPWLAITIAAVLVLVSIAGPIVVAIRLLHRARRPLPLSTQPAEGTGPLLTSMSA